MGCDGGSIPKRCEVVKIKAKDEVLDDSEVLKTQWTRCFISKKPLQRPIVVCSLGRLYNKDAIIVFLLNREDTDAALSAELSHIKSLKHVLNAKLTDSNSNDTPYFTCPVTGREMNGKSRFVAVKDCGCVLSDQALREFPDSTKCLVCERPNFNMKTDTITLYPKPGEVEELKKSLTPSTTSVSMTDKKSKRRQPESKAQDLLTEIKSSGGEVTTLKRTKVTDSLYLNS